MQDYTPEVAPAPADWLALDAVDRVALVRAVVGVDAAGLDWEEIGHIVAAEDMLAKGERPAARALVDRLLAQGLTRRAALEALGSQVGGMLFRVLSNQADVDASDVIDDLLTDGLECLDGGLNRAIRRIVSAGDFPPEGVQRALILHAGRDALPQLFELMNDRREWDLDSESMGWAPLHALKLIAAIGDPASIEGVIDFVVEAWPEGVLDGALPMLEAFGGAIIDPALARHDASQDDDLKLMLLTLAAQADVEDRRIYDRLVGHLEAYPTLASHGLVLYRDDDAVPLLQARLERLDPVAQPMAYEQVASAITSLGGALSATQTEAAESAQYHLHRAAMGPDATPAPAPRGGTGGAAARQKKKAARQMKKKSRPKKKK